MRWLQMAKRYAIFSFFFKLQFSFMIINLKMVLLNLIFFFFVLLEDKRYFVFFLFLLCC